MESQARIVVGFPVVFVHCACCIHGACFGCQPWLFGFGYRLVLVPQGVSAVRDVAVYADWCWCVLVRSGLLLRPRRVSLFLLLLLLMYVSSGTAYWFKRRSLRWLESVLLLSSMLRVYVG